MAFWEEMRRDVMDSHAQRRLRARSLPRPQAYRATHKIGSQDDKNVNDTCTGDMRCVNGIVTYNSAEEKPYGLSVGTCCVSNRKY